MNASPRLPGKRLSLLNRVVFLAALLLPALIQAAEGAPEAPPTNMRDALMAAVLHAWQIMVEYLPLLLGAFLVLLLGLLLAKLIAKAVTHGIRATNVEARCEKMGLSGLAKVSDIFGYIAFWLVMLAVLIVFFDVLRLPIITEPLAKMVSEVALYIPRLVGALFILFCAWIIAVILRTLTSSALRARNLDAVYESKTGATDETQKPIGIRPSDAIGNVVYGLVLIFALPMFFEALQLESVVKPLQDMVSKFLNIIPSIFGAAVIIVVGFIVAKFVRDLVTNMVAASKLEALAKKSGVGNLASVVGITVYALILVPVVLVALNTLQLEVITKPSELMLSQLLSAVPRVFAAALILFISYVLAHFVGSLASTFLNGLGLDALLVRWGVISSAVTKEPKTASKFCGSLAVAFVMVAAIMEAADFLSLTKVSKLLSDLIPFLSHALLALMALVVGIALANAAARFVNEAAGPERRWLGVIAKVAVLYVAVGFALNTLGVANQVVVVAFALPLAALFISAAIGFGVAFGIGGKKIASEKLELWFGSHPK